MLHDADRASVGVVPPGAECFADGRTVVAYVDRSAFPYCEEAVDRVITVAVSFGVAQFGLGFPEDRD